MELTDAQWEVLMPHLAGGKSGPGKRGRPRKDDRLVLEGVLWVLRTGARWKRHAQGVRAIPDVPSPVQ